MKNLFSFLLFTCVFWFQLLPVSGQDYLMNSTAETTCSGTFYDAGGPGSNYSNQSGGTVLKTFTSSNGNRLRFDFTQFITEGNGLDFMTVFDGPDNTYPLIGTYQGSLAPFSIQSTGTSLTIGFRSSFSNTFAGWTANIQCTTPPLPVYNMASGTINTCTGIFFDNGGPNLNYPAFENRTQTICSDNGQKLVANFTFANLNSGDTLWAYDGNSVSSPLLGIYSVGSVIETLTSSGTCLTFRFKSDATSQSEGWRAELSCTNSNPPVSVYTHSSGIRATCNGIFTDDGGEGSNYTNLSGGTRTQTFTSYNGNRLKFNFQQFVTETGVDVLTVYDGPNSSFPVIGQYSGSLAPFSIEGSGNSLTFSFFSNFQTNFAGWRGTFECTTPVLPEYPMTGGTTTTCSGMFYDAGGAGSAYPNFDNRTQTFCSGNGQKLVATFNPLNTGLASNDTLWAYDGASTTSPLLGIYVTGSTIERLPATGTCLTFRFKSDATGNANGWAALLSCTTASPNPTVFVQSSGTRFVCDGIFTDDGGENFNYSNLSAGTKVQTFTSYNGNRLKFNFQQFVTENGTDVLRVYDGPTTAFPLIGAYSGNLPNFSVEGSGRSLTFAFTSSFQTNFAGWRGTFECTTPVLNVYNLSSGTVNACSGMFYDNGGANGNYPNFENRSQTFCADNGQKIQFNFNQNAFSLSGGDTLFVYDGPGTGSNPLAVFTTGSNVETLTSSGTCLTFLFKSVASPSTGWAAEFSCVTTPPAQIVYPISSGQRYVCSGLFTDDGGTGFNYNNLSGVSKTQTFTSYNGSRLKINFQQFITESGLDVLQVYDGPSVSSPLIGTYSGTLAPFSIEATGRSLTFRFSSSFQTNFAGWQGTFECTTPVLPVYNMSSGTTTSCAGVFYDAGGSQSAYPSFENRSQTFCSSNGQKVQFVFNMRAYSIQSGDSLWVYDGNSTNSPLAGIYVNGSNVETLTSTGTCLTFRFKSAANGSLDGWQAILRCVSEAPAQMVYPISSGVRVVCSGVFTDDGGLTGNYSNLSGGNRTQTFQSATGGRMSVVFNSFVMETNSDYLDIFDGPNTSFPRLARLTGTVASGTTFTSTGTHLTFSMGTSFQTNFAGWVANLACSGPALTSYNMSSGTINTCSGVFYDNGGGGREYPNNENRVQTICSDNGQHIVFDFTNFNLTGNDSLLVYDGNSVSSPLIGVYLNGFLPEKLTSSGTCLTFRFRSDFTSQLEGWKALISCSPDDALPLVYPMNSGWRATCNGVFTDDGGLSGSSSNSQNRVMTLQGYNGQRIRLNFQSFSLENGFDFLRIYDGPNTNSPILGQFTGTNSPGILTSSGSTLTFWFTSNSSITGNWLASIECAGTPLPVFNMSSGTVNTCSGIFYDAGGVSGIYPSNENRIQTFCSDNGQKIQFNFNNLAFQVLDTLWAYDGPSTASNLIGIYVGSSFIEPITSSGTCVTFRFKSDNQNESGGWAAAISCTTSAPDPMIYPMSTGVRSVCSGVFTDNGGINGNYLNGGIFTQTFQSPNNNRLRFEFNQFSTEPNNDYLDVYDGPSNLFPYLGRFTANNNPGVILSSGNSLTFVFRADNTINTAGWIANISCAGPVLPSFNMSTSNITACEGMWYDNSGPGRTYSPGLNLVQTICSGNNQRLMFTFSTNEFVLASTDTLFAYDGNSISSPLIGAYTGGRIEPLVSSGNCITFRFKGLSSSGSVGWAAYFTCTNNPPQPEIYTIRPGIRGACSGIFTDEGGATGVYGVNQSRTMVFVSNTPGARLQFNFTQFATESGSDLLRIYDGASISAPLIGTYSGTTGPGIVTSTGSSLTFRWTTDVSVVNSGWIASIACVSTVPLVGTLSSGPYCAGGSLQIPFTSPTQTAGNVFSAQLSDANGAFSNPVTIGTLNGTGSGIITGNLPANLVSGSNYKIRILGSNPATSGSPSFPITIFALPGNIPSISGANSLCAGSQNVTYSVGNISNAASYVWNVPTGFTIVSGQGTNSIVVNFGSSSGNITCQAVNPCGNSNTATLAINVTAATVPTATISSNATNGSVCNGGNVTFSSTVSAGLNPRYQWILNGSDVAGATGTTFTLNNLFSNASVSLRVTSTSNCFLPSTITSGSVAINVQSSATPSALIATTAPGNATCSGNPVNFTSSLQNQGLSPSFQWKINGINVPGANGSTFSTSTLQNGDEVSLQMTSNAACASPATVVSSGLTMIVNQTVTPTVSITSNTGGNQVCAGNVLILNAGVSNGGDNPQYQWLQNGSTIPGETGLSYTLPSGLTGSQNFSVRLISNAVCATQTQVTSSTFTVTGVSSVTPSVTVSSNLPSGPVCVGTPITFTATPTNGGSTPGYQWRVNGNPVNGQTGSTFTSSTLSNNDQVTVVLTSVDPCANPTTATSAVATVNLVSSLTPGVNVVSSASGNTICAGEAVTFTANPTNGGNNPGFVWRINGTPVNGQTASTFSTSTLTTGQQVTVQLTSSFSCANPQTATSSPIAITVNSPVTPTASVSSSQGNAVCQGSSTVLTANVTNPGTNPGYQWFLNGNPVNGATSATYSTPTSLTGTANYKVQLTSNANCVNPPTVTSSDFALTITPSVTPAVSFGSSVAGNTLCSGQSVTFTAIPQNSGPNPQFQWLIDGQVVNGQTNPTFTTSTLTNGQTVSVRLTSGALCANPATVTAPSQTITVTPNSPAGVSVTSNATNNAACAGQPVLFTANPVNGGNNPTYQWIVNGNDVTGQTGSTFETSTLTGNSQVSVRITSNSTCANPAVATSAPVTTTINPSVTPSVVLSSQPTGTAFCAGSQIQFTANPTNGGTNPTYQWRVNGNVVNGVTGPDFQLTLTQPSTITATLLSTANCANPSSVVSSGVVLSLNPGPTVTAQNDTTVCEATSPFTLRALPAGGSWSGTGVNSAGIVTPGNPGTLKAFYTYTESGCTGIDSVTITIQSRPAISFPTQQPICATAPARQLSANPTGGTWTGTGISPGGLFNPATTGAGQQVVTYTVLQNGCQASRVLLLDVSAPPTVDIGGNETVCFSTQSVQMVGLPAGGSWSGDGVNASGLFTPGFVQPGTTVTLTYSVTANGCTASQTKQVSVSFNPAAVNAGTDQTVCVSDQPFILQGVVGSGGTWSGTGVSANGIFSPSVSGQGTFTLTYTVTFNQSPTCAGTDTKTVTVIPSPAAPVTTGDTICRSGSGTLSATGNAAQFRWYTTQAGGNPIAGQNSSLLATPVLNSTTTYYVSQVAGSCESPRTPVTAFVNSFNNASFTVGDLPVTLTASPANGQSYQWLLAGNLIPGANQSTYLPTQTADYSVVIRLDGCADTSAQQFVLITSTNKPEAEIKWNVYPNPVPQLLYIEGTGLKEATLIDALGKTVLIEKPGSTENHRMDVSALPNGFYTLELKTAEGVKRMKIVKK